MKFTDKILKAKRRSIFSYVIGFFVVIYFCMITIKGIYFWTEGSLFTFAHNIHMWTSWLIAETRPINGLWQIIPAIPFEGRDILAFYKVIIPPFVIFGVCALFILDHRILKQKFYELKDQIEKEIALREMREEAGLETLKENSTIDIMVRNATNDDPPWHDTWWGRVVIGVAIVLVVTAFGLK
ncbi:hypothetical protein ACJJIC_15585 [Microbulbifer sp. ANSA002]|uniref:hypothetical protein n=1 Tax=unclassified Microbulbifer TaxID=2619833 RepID=UPI004041F7B2